MVGMSEANAQHEFDPPQFEAGHLRAAVVQDDRRFNLWLVAVAVAHTLLMIGFNSAAPRRIGDPSGGEDAISVALVTEADLHGHATVDDKAAGLPALPARGAQTALPPAEPASAPQPQAQPLEAVPPPAAAASQRPKAMTATEPGTEPPPNASEAKPEQSTPHEGTAQAAKPTEKATRQAKPQDAKTRTAELDLTPPPSVFAAPSGRGGAGVERPPGITRSGENDAFARGVIRALQQTMPQLRDTFGRVTVRITLDMNGGLVSTQVVKPSQIAGLDQSVVFATRQSSFPFPPRNANSADLIFVVTYIYR